ncbi:oxidoreductase [Chimaeribacter arupi]|uniref:Oxidoreductase n=2 Tax=Yersiniaceae TaxID=1903411 RepID=A0A2N5ES83_9GAMM|nr:MDR family oxidoreductase [Chimaeribacter arupi]MDV5138561.1 MDR family oxidoreductase [Chimaeribacter arupi]PLR50868.1 oxidoreductase [Chimaeribacter arupi]PLR52719.1 oxidoreductase [Chimaeribacter arupi]WKZ92030.1 oxidoreductase [Chimaeribacter arupi]
MKALLLEQHEGRIAAEIQEIAPDRLPDGDVTVEVGWSGLNYKDALAITGKGKIVRNFPMVPGIDFAGTVVDSKDHRFRPGQQVVLTGWGVGETHWGGLAERARVNADWLVALPPALSARQSMIIGTAGLTAMLCVMALEEGGVAPQSGEVLVTGASGGVGSTAVAILAQQGYRVTAVSGRPHTHPYLRDLGAAHILPREEFFETARPLETQRWAGAIDTVGDRLLANVLAQMNYNGVVAACGLAGGYLLPTTVMPFILRNVRLQGIDSVRAPLHRRQAAWERLAGLLPARFYEQAATEISLEEVPEAAAALMDNRITGRTLVRIGG